MSVISEPVTGWQLSAAGGYSTALDLTLTDDLRRGGLARDLVRHPNNLRKRNGFTRSDRVTITVHLVDDPDGLLRLAIQQHHDTITRDVLAVALTLTGPDAAETGTSTAVGPGAAAARARHQAQPRESHPGTVPLQAGTALALVSLAPAGT